MDHGQVQETVEQARVQQVVKLAAEEAFVAFNARLNRAQGLDVVRRHAKNPLGLDVVVGALMRALGSVHLDEAVRARWLSAGALPLGQELEKLYQRLSDQLDRWGVQPAGFQVVQQGTPRPVQAVPRSESVPAASLIGMHCSRLTTCTSCWWATSIRAGRACPTKAPPGRAMPWCARWPRRWSPSC